MRMHHDYVLDYQFPLCSVEIVKQKANPIRYLGSGFFVNDSGMCITCKHVLEGADLNKVVAFDPFSGKFWPFTTVWEHTKKDFMVLQMKKDGTKYYKMYDEKYILAADVQAYGFTFDRKECDYLVLHPRIFKGNIVRLHSKPPFEHALSTCELSFPALSGFSGTPVVLQEDVYSVVGMIYSNFESGIIQHSYSEVTDDGTEMKEYTKRIIELGVAHTIPDIKSLLSDMEINPW